MRIEGEAQAPDFDRLSGLRLKIGDHPRSVAIQVEQDGYEENHHEQQSGDYEQDELGPAPNGHGKLETASGLCVTALPGLRLYATATGARFRNSSVRRRPSPNRCHG